MNRWKAEISRDRELRKHLKKVTVPHAKGYENAQASMFFNEKVTVLHIKNARLKRGLFLRKKWRFRTGDKPARLRQHLKKWCFCTRNRNVRMLPQIKKVMDLHGLWRGSWSDSIKKWRFCTSIDRMMIVSAEHYMLWLRKAQRHYVRADKNGGWAYKKWRICTQAYRQCS